VNRYRRTGSLALAAVLSAVSTVLLTAGPALADNNPIGPSEGSDPGPSLSPAATIALYVLLPAAIMAAIAALVLLPGLVRGTRYRPAMGWAAAPVWFAGPLDPATAVADAQPGDVVRGGGSGSW
jgi:hypothetical protein